MTINATATEVHGKSDSGKINATGSKTVTRRFHVIGGDDGEGEPSPPGANLPLIDALAAIGLPEPPDGDEAQSYFDIDGETLSYWGSRSFQRVDGHQDLWLLTYDYSTSPQSAGGGEGTERSGSSRATTKGVYRTGAAVPLNPNNPGKQDIGGKRVDIGGQKTTVVYPSTSLLIKVYTPYPVYASHFAGVVGKRNSNHWNGFGAGSVLFVGANYSLNNSTSMWEIEYEFAIDFLTAHLEQVAITQPGGEVQLEKSGSVPNETFQAKHVYWVQPFGLAGFGFPI